MADKGGIELAKAYVQIVPSAEGIGDKIKSALGDMSAVGASAGKSIGGNLVSTAASLVASGASAVASAAADICTSALSAVTSITKEAISSYAEFEQLRGGAELMFGDGYDYIMEKAQQAYSAVQMSQNDYLEQVNGLAVGLKTALGGNAQAAAELADKVITAEADVVAATGNSQEAVQNAFNGIMKSNYSMMDNLGLGITPTKEGFQEVIDKVNEWHAAQGDLTEYTMDSLADQQAALVDYVEMCGMAGYAQAEASDTIQGTLSSLRAAWQNLLTGMADPTQDIDALIGNFLESLEGFLSNIVPRLKAAIPGVLSTITSLGQSVIAYLPSVLSELLPAVIGGVTSLATGIADALPDILNVIVDCIPMIIAALGTILTAILGIMPDIVQAGMDLLVGLISGFAQMLPTMLPTLTECVMQIVAVLTDPTNLGALISAGIALLMALLQGLIESLPVIIQYLPTIISNIATTIAENLPLILDAGIQIIQMLLMGIVQTVPQLIGQIPSIVSSIVSAFGSLLSKMADIGKNLIQGLWNGISNAVSWLYDKISGFCGGVMDYIKNLFGIHSPSKEMAWVGEMLDEGLAEGINDSMGSVNDAVDGIVDATTGSLSSEIGVNGHSTITYDDRTSSAVGIYALLQQYLPYLTQQKDIYIDGSKVAKATYPSLKKEVEKNYRIGNLLMGVN